MPATTLEQTGIIFLVDDDAGARTGLQELLASHGYQTEAFCSAVAFLDRLPIETTGCLVLDLHMPQMSGMELQEELAARGCTIPIVFLTAHGDIPTTVRAVKRGAEDFLPKLAEEEELLDAIQRAVQRSTQILDDEQRQQHLKHRASSLTGREREVCQYLIAGLLNKQIARRLHISDRTVKAHKAKVMEKFDVESIAELVRLAAQSGITPAETQPRLR